MNGISLEIDTTNIPLERLKELYRRFERKHRWEGGQAEWLLLLENAIENHPETKAKQEEEQSNVG